MLIAVQVGVLLLLGQPAICTCAYVKLWEGDVLSSGASQHLSDWYTFSHIIHGFLFYLFIKLVFPKIPVAQRLLMALGIEIGWEILENSPMIINAYRQQALSQGYVGDSILNSVSDTLAMALGFFLAWRWPPWATVLIAVALEVWVALIVRDNLTLNVLNFIHQFDFITQWQSHG